MDVLVEKSVVKDAVPVLVVCNKSDHLLAMPKEKVQNLLEAEL
jgi:signal recognition particle receptor subunit beta